MASLDFICGYLEYPPELVDFSLNFLSGCLPWASAA